MNPHDQKSRDVGLFTRDKLPAILANDVAGEIVELGPTDTKDYHVGDRVFTQSNIFAGPDHGGLQQYCLVDVNFSSKVPSKISDDEAATTPCNLIAAYMAFFLPTGLGLPLPTTEATRSVDLQHEKLLIIGGGSNTGKFGIQLAKWAGIGQIIVVAAVHNEKRLKELGATAVIDRHSADVLGDIKGLVGDDLVYAYDTVNGGDGITLAIAALSDSKSGKVASLLPGEPDSSKVGKKVKGFELEHILGSSWMYPEAASRFWKSLLPDWIDSGVVTPLEYKVVEDLNAAAVNATYDNYRDGKVQGKVHIHP